MALAPGLRGLVRPVTAVPLPVTNVAAEDALPVPAVELVRLALQARQRGQTWRLPLALGDVARVVLLRPGQAPGRSLAVRVSRDKREESWWHKLIVGA